MDYDSLGALSLLNLSHNLSPYNVKKSAVTSHEALVHNKRSQSMDSGITPDFEISYSDISTNKSKNAIKTISFAVDTKYSNNSSFGQNYSNNKLENKTCSNSTTQRKEPDNQLKIIDPSVDISISDNNTNFICHSPSFVHKKSQNKFQDLTHRRCLSYDVYSNHYSFNTNDVKLMPSINNGCIYQQTSPSKTLGKNTIHSETTNCINNKSPIDNCEKTCDISDSGSAKLLFSSPKQSETSAKLSELIRNSSPNLLSPVIVSKKPITDVNSSNLLNSSMSKTLTKQISNSTTHTLQSEKSNASISTITKSTTSHHHHYKPRKNTAQQTSWLLRWKFISSNQLTSRFISFYK